MRDGGIHPDTVELPWEPARELCALPADKVWNVVAAWAIERQAAGQQVRWEIKNRIVELSGEGSPGVKSYIKLEVQDNGYGSRVIVTFGLRGVEPMALRRFAAQQVPVPQTQPPKDVCELARDVVKEAQRLERGDLEPAGVDLD